ncbi:DUF4956 domain-containing protein [Clostridium grantii]|uniref:DUF4956 domain-containing protein n=1 Tax=Clostridium grantii DSM 8605 TaxID=1121316 RepID=A0A1M5W0G6_9CLOT|nr:DUF4956 domain-containing protein [Clostridium grantii]SHH80995.1 protein of unknown function [Clostridium grantii DSM 8605]
MNELINFQDIIKKSVLKSSFIGSFQIQDIVLVIGVTLAVSLYMFFVYKKSFSGVIYNHNFNVALVLMAIITSIIIMTISSNLVLSLGMVGALSIVRFRTAVKDSLDIVFMFWAIAIGLTCGARLYSIALIGSLLVGIIALMLLKYKNSNNIYLLIINYRRDAKEEVERNIIKLDNKIKSKTVTAGITELTLEVKLIGSDTTFIEKISDINGVENASLISYNGSFAQ